MLDYIAVGRVVRLTTSRFVALAVQVGRAWLSSVPVVLCSRLLDANVMPEANLSETTDDPFFEPYDRSDIAYGERPSAPLAAYLRQCPRSGWPRALDLGAGAGRDTLALARAGFRVTAVDLSARGLGRIRERAAAASLADRVDTQVEDVRRVEFAPAAYGAVVATTVLDHIPLADARDVWSRMCASLDDQGVMYVEVHTTEDPGCDSLPGANRDAPVSETADAVINYFAPNQLAQWAADPRRRLRILRYEERLEWDYTHGPEHLHGKAILLAVRSGHHPDWYGQPAAFPRYGGPMGDG